MREMEFAFQIQRPLVLAVGTSGVGPQCRNFRGEAPRIVEIRLRYSAVFADSVILG